MIGVHVDTVFIVRALDCSQSALNGHKQRQYHGGEQAEPYFAFLDSIIDVCASPDERRIVGYV
jgi:hypothetical protein